MDEIRFQTPHYDRKRANSILLGLVMPLPSETQGLSQNFGMFLSHMVAVRRVKEEIFQSVVGLVTVDVVDTLGSSQGAP